MIENKKVEKKQVFDFNFGKVPPQDIELEKSVLGVILLEQQAFAVANNLIRTPEIFYIEAHKIIYKGCIELFDQNRPIDLLTIVDVLRKSNNLEKVGGAFAITMLTHAVTSSAHLEDWCKVLIEQYMKRQGIKIGANMITDCYNEETDPFDLYQKYDGELIDTQEAALSGQIKDIEYFASEVYKSYEQVESTGILGLKTGIEPIDRVLCGLVAPDLIVVAARPSMGKTALAMSIVKNTSVDQNIPVGIFSLEMDGEQLVRRLASNISNINHEYIREGKIYENQKPTFYQALDKISKAPIYIEDKSAINIRELRSRAIILKRKFNIQYIVLDYIQLMSGVDARNKNRNDIVGEISRGLKNLCRELKIPIIALSQMSRKVEERADKMPVMSDLRESGAIEQDSDSILMLMRPEKYGIMSVYELEGVEYSPNNLCIGVIEKNRHGEIKKIPMYFEGPTMRMSTHPDSSNRLSNSLNKKIMIGYNNQDTQRVLPPSDRDNDGIPDNFMF